jgi:hypothetical protein
MGSVAHLLASDTTSPSFCGIKRGKKRHGGPLLAATCYWASKSHEIPQVTGSVLVHTENSASEKECPPSPKKKKKQKRKTEE